MAPAELLVEVREGGYETLVVRVITAVLRLQLSSQLCLTVTHCPTKTNVLADLAIWVIMISILLMMRMRRKMRRRKRKRMMRIFTVSSGGRDEVSRREVAEARCRGGGARVNWIIVISHDDDDDDDGDDDDDDDAHLESPGAAAELLNVGAA